MCSVLVSMGAIFFWFAATYSILMPNSKTSKIVQKTLKKCQKMKNISKNGVKLLKQLFSD
jgi:hypothetical protein